MAQQEDGYYPRINAAMLNSTQFNGKIVSLVGSVESFDGTTVMLKCADHATVAVNADGTDFNQPTGTFVELVGFVNEDKSVTLFVTRELSNDTDLDIYNKMIQIQSNPKFAGYFQPAEV